LNDLKKSLQIELKFHTLPNEVLPDVKKNVQSVQVPSVNSIADLKAEQQHQQRTRPKLKSQSSESSFIGDEINFKYLKHVLLKFLTSREYEVSGS
jgi:golgin subfamily A protein 1